MIKLYIIAGIVFVIGLLLKIYYPYIRGYMGEKAVSRLLNELDKKQYTVLHDILLPSDGSTHYTQIDHIIVSDFGIICLETKNYSGWIFGDAKQKEWTQVIYKHKERFYNPLRQNYAHIKALEKVLIPAFPNVRIIGIVVFPSAGKLQISGTDAVVSLGDLRNAIDRYRDIVISTEDKQKILAALRSAYITDKKARKAHAHDVRSINHAL